MGSKDVPQFAPNFSVYLLPRDVVCLYSEHRKFFLHGELYAALATAIGAGKSFGQIVRELTKKFPADKIDEALNRLIERRYVILKGRSSATIAATYWASLGLAPDAAEKNLQNCRVRLESIDVKGAEELGAALSKLGVRIVNKGAADLTVTLVNDYLEARLRKLNRKHLSDGTPWLLVQPSGIFPLVGPVFTPGKGACWSCLADRMSRNREIKSMLDREQARCIAVSPLSQDPLGQSGIELAAVEIAKAIATGLRTDLNDHIVSLDLTGSTIARHYVAARPQCPECGQKKLRDPRRAPTPIALAAGAKLVMTSGGYRSVSSRATVSRFRKHVSPLTGVVSRLERVEADLPLNTNYYASHNFSAPAKTVDELRSGLSGGSFGKGSTAEQGEASALMEAIERYSGIFQGDEIRLRRRFTDFPPGDAILPNDVQLFSDAQFRGERLATEGPELTPTPPPFDPSAEIEWSSVWSLRDERFKYLPTGLLYFFHTDSLVAGEIHADSNGCAAGNTIEEAIVQGFLELVERDSYAIWWYNRLQRHELDLSQFDDSYIRDLKSQLAETGRRLWVL
ncbi:MAG: TOMM precursor leader peptide-binding protein, partial [Xanthobacteraceae bacterium]